MILNKIVQHIKMYISKYNRNIFIMRNKIKKLENRNFTIISSNCNGGVIYSDFKQRFDSPTINLFIMPNDFIKFCQNLEYYMECELHEVLDSSFSYPIGILDNEIKIYFMHYSSFDEAKKKWDTRKKRINYNNIFFMMTDRDGCSYQNIIDFDSLKYKNKIIFTSKKYENIKSSIFCDEFQNDNEVGILTNYRNLKGERIYDRYFDVVRWLNGKM